MTDSTSELDFPWDELGLAPTRDTAEIQRAYARRLKTIDLASQRDAFLALRRAYEEALIEAARESEPELEEDKETEEDLAAELADDLAQQSMPPPRARYFPDVALVSPTEPFDWAPLQTFFDAFAAKGTARDLSGAKGELDRLLHTTSLPIEIQGEIEARLFSIVMDDPSMPVELLAHLAGHFRWTEIGSGLEVNRPDLYARFLYRVSAAHAWLEKVQEAAGDLPPQWQQFMETFRLGIVAPTPSRTARLLLMPYRWYFVLRRPGGYHRETLDELLREARRFGPLLGGAIDPKMVAFLWSDLEHSKTMSTILDKAVGIACAFVALVTGCVAVREPSRDSLTLFAVVLGIVVLANRARAFSRRQRARQQTSLRPPR